MKNSNGFWQALKAGFVSKRARAIWKIVACLIRLGLMIVKLLELLDKHSES